MSIIHISSHLTKQDTDIQSTNDPNKIINQLEAFRQSVQSNIDKTANVLDSREYFWIKKLEEAERENQYLQQKLHDEELTRFTLFERIKLLQQITNDSEIEKKELKEYIDKLEKMFIDEENRGQVRKIIIDELKVRLIALGDELWVNLFFRHKLFKKKCDKEKYINTMPIIKE